MQEPRQVLFHKKIIWCSERQRVNIKTTQKSGGLIYLILKSSLKTVSGVNFRLTCDPARARTEDPKIKSLLLYQLSYGVENGVQIYKEFILQKVFRPYICTPKKGA